MDTLILVCGGAVTLGFLGFIIYSANQQDVHGNRSLGFRWMLYTTIGLNLLFGWFALQAALVLRDPEMADALKPFDAGIEISLQAALFSFGLGAVTSIISFAAINSGRFRQWIRARLSADNTYNPESAVHITAIVLALVLISFNLITFILAGGITGMATDIELSGISPGAIFFQEVLWIFAALLGVGFAIRRDFSQTLARLGLRLPTRQDILAGIGVAIASYVLVIAFSFIWTALTSPELFQEQTAASDQFARSFDSLPFVLYVSIIVAFGEEIIFRGALQPVFGIVLTSIFFTLIHTQYSLTPATLVLFVVALGLGWLRKRYSTTSSIIAHFLFNFIQLALAVLVGGALGGP